jgi:hypothetical protein
MRAAPGGSGGGSLNCWGAAAAVLATGFPHPVQNTLPSDAWVPQDEQNMDFLPFM